MSTSAIFTVLAQIPWGQVVDNAPKLAEGAAKLWKTVRRSRQEAPETVTNDPSMAVEPSQTDQLRAQVQRLEDEVSGLREQMQASTELIKALADQNAQLVQRIEINRQRVTRLAYVGAACGALLLGMAGILWATR